MTPGMPAARFPGSAQRPLRRHEHATVPLVGESSLIGREGRHVADCPGRWFPIFFGPGAADCGRPDCRLTMLACSSRPLNRAARALVVLGGLAAVVRSRRWAWSGALVAETEQRCLPVFSWFGQTGRAWSNRVISIPLLLRIHTMSMTSLICVGCALDNGCCCLPTGLG